LKIEEESELAVERIALVVLVLVIGLFLLYTRYIVKNFNGLQDKLRQAVVELDYTERIAEDIRLTIMTALENEEWPDERDIGRAFGNLKGSIINVHETLQSEE